MSEKAVAFGPNRSLAGVWTEPSDPTAGEGRPVVILLNSGIVHHVGVSRLHVRIARILEPMGFPSLRFDLSGIGDSDSARDAVDLGDSVLRDLASAVEYVGEAHDRHHIVMVGLCSGGRDALEAAVHHSEVVGTVAIDLISDFITWRYHAAHFAPRLLRWENWKNTLLLRNVRIQQLGRVLLRRREPAADDNVSAAPLPTSGPRSDLTRDGLREMLSSLFARDLQALFVFSNGLEGNYNHRTQFAGALPHVAKDPRVAVEFFPRADHVFSDPDQQRALITQITDWIGDRFGAGTENMR